MTRVDESTLKPLDEVSTPGQYHQTESFSAKWLPSKRAVVWLKYLIFTQKHLFDIGELCSRVSLLFFCNRYTETRSTFSYLPPHFGCLLHSTAATISREIPCVTIQGPQRMTHNVFGDHSYCYIAWNHTLLFQRASQSVQHMIPSVLRPSAGTRKAFKNLLLRVNEGVTEDGSLSPDGKIISVNMYRENKSSCSTITKWMSSILRRHQAPVGPGAKKQPCHSIPVLTP